MSISVKQLSSRFGYLNKEDLRSLTGKSDYKEDDEVSLGKLANYGRDMQVYAARKEGAAFLGFLHGQQKIDVAESAGITVPSVKQSSNPFGKKKEGSEHMRNYALGAYIAPERKAWIG